MKKGARQSQRSAMGSEEPLSSPINLTLITSHQIGHRKVHRTKNQRHAPHHISDNGAISYLFALHKGRVNVCFKGVNEILWDGSDAFDKDVEGNDIMFLNKGLGCYILAV